MTSQIRPKASPKRKRLEPQKDETPRENERFLGAPGAIRTPDPQIRRTVLYPREESGTAEDASECAQPVGTNDSDAPNAQSERGVCPKSVPSNPTRGWMFSELDRHGVHLRGQPLTDAQLVKQLAIVGVHVDAGNAARAPRTKEDR